MALSKKDVDKFGSEFASLSENIETVLFGKRTVIDLIIAAMVSEGHVLLEDFPGTGKTALARALSQSIKGVSQRIQFTPDLLPGDVTGITVYDQKKGTFSFHQGPIFANVVLADEINRASPKTQSALLEAMEEARVTIDGVTRSTGSPFLVIATQNPIEQAGTYRLPEAQLDRFMIKTSVGYPDNSSTVRILEGTAQAASDLKPVMTLDRILWMVEVARSAFISQSVFDYIARLVEATRTAPQVKMGSSVRGARNLAKLSRTWALAKGRNYVIPDDVKDIAEAVLAHRIVIDPEAEFDGVTANAIIAQILLQTVPPAGAETE
jgi:MoxR-like ATPase